MFVLDRNKFFINIEVDFQVDSESISVGNTVGNTAVGNLIGGIGYFYGQSKIALSSIFNVSYFVLLFIVLIEEYATPKYIAYILTCDVTIRNMGVFLCAIFLLGKDKF